MSAADDRTKSAGRGGIAIAAAKIYFIVVGLVQQIALVHILGLDVYGGLSKVQSAGSMVYNPVVYTGVQGMSRAVSSAPDEQRGVVTRNALRVHAATGVPLAIAFFLAAPWITRHAMKAPHLTTPIRIIAGVLLFYALYAPLVGVLNGQRRFGWQAGLDTLFATVRTIGLLAGAWLLARRGLGIEGALSGFVAAAAIIFAIALPVSGVWRRHKAEATSPASTSKDGGFTRHLWFIAPLFGGQLALNLLFQSDFQLLGRFAAVAGERAGVGAQEADALAGAYRAAQLFCFLPYQLLLSVTFVLFPLLATAHRDRNRNAVAQYTRTGVRLAVIIAGALVSVTASLPGPLLNLVFGQQAAALGARAMFILAIGLGVFAIFGILTTVLTSLGREIASALCTVLALALVVVLCFTFVSGHAYGEGLLIRTAACTSAGLLTACIIAAILVKRTAGAVVPWPTLLRVGVALSAAIAVGRWLPSPGKPLTIVYALVLVLIYTALLVVSRELERRDLALVMTVLGRKR